MNVLILSDFSPVAINATLYAMDLLQEQRVNFTLLNIHVPNSEATEEEQEGKRAATKARLQERVEDLEKRCSNRPHKITGYYSEEKLVTAARLFLEEQEVDLIVMGAVGEKSRHSTILGNHTFEIMSKIKCNILAVPDEHDYHGLERMLLPLDYSASFRRRNLQFLINQKIFHRTRLNVWEIEDNSNTDPEERSMYEEIFSELNHIRVDFSTIDKSAVNNKSIWKAVQKKFQLIILMGKNIRICNELMHNSHGLFTSMPNRLPILVLHD